jgi:hypothetical protein
MAYQGSDGPGEKPTGLFPSDDAKRQATIQAWRFFFCRFKSFCRKEVTVIGD